MVRGFAKLLLLVFLLLVVAAGVLQWARQRAEPAQPVRGSVTRVRNLFADFYAAHNGGRILLFDAGADPWGQALDTLLAKTPRDQVTDVFVTHGHPDHIAALSLCKSARVHAGKDDAAIIEQTRGAEPLIARAVSYLLPRPAAKVVDALAGDIDVPVGAGQSVRAIPMPGHTRGSYAYLWEGVLFVGDSIQYKEGALAPADPNFTVDAEENAKSIAALAPLVKAGKILTVCTGHFGCTPPSDTKKLLTQLIEAAGK
jgi:glyoxylase-like metal-dependent hydrolase (beta-lactamase superfamily II)